MKHYFNPMSRGATTDWMLKELGVPHQQIIVDFAAGENKSAEFRNINPMQKLPVLVDGNTVITEVAAICAYLADRFPERGFAPEIGSAERGAYYRYLFIAGNTIEPALTLAVLDMEHPRPVSAGWGDMPRVLDTIETMTPDTDWALGEQFTTADIVFGGLLDFSMAFNMIEASAKVTAYVERLRSRSAYKESHEAMINTDNES